MSDSSIEVPFQPIRNTLYSSMELMGGYDPKIPDTMEQTIDFRSYKYYVANGAAAPKNPYAGMMEALHDNSIFRAMTAFIAQHQRPIVGIMGGHGITRDSDTFRSVVEIARLLTQRECLVASGGGPGAMEATHLGALLVNATDDKVADAIRSLKTKAELPKNSKDVVGKNGKVDSTILRELHAWARPAYEIAQAYPNGGKSLAIPTWYYGHEPISPLATSVAKYFQNSIREDVLLSISANGIIYTPGAAGTLQEVFQDAAQNYYRNSGELIAPMIFFGREFWEKQLPVMDVLRALFVGRNNISEAEFLERVKIVDSVKDAVDAITQHAPSRDKTLDRMAALGFGPMMDSLGDYRSSGSAG